jgi:DNA-binding ferritin-like protein (Dps family)
MNQEDIEIFHAFEGVVDAFNGKSMEVISQNIAAFIYAYLEEIPKEERDTWAKKFSDDISEVLAKSKANKK